VSVKNSKTQIPNRSTDWFKVQMPMSEILFAPFVLAAIPHHSTLNSRQQTPKFNITSLFGALDIGMWDLLASLLLAQHVTI
jgi:hypothetical protein